jgi:transketolase
VIDAYSLQPIDAATLVAAARPRKAESLPSRITIRLVAWATPRAGRGIGGFAVRRLAVRQIPRSGQPEELLDRYGISAKHIVEAVKKLL